LHEQNERRTSASSLFAGLDWLSTSAVLLNVTGQVVFLNQAAEQMFGISVRTSMGQVFAKQFANPSVLEQLLADAFGNNYEQRRQEIVLERLNADPISLICTASLVHSQIGFLMLEFSELEQRAKLAHDEHMSELANANRELVRNLAHEIKNPLGGIRGAAQLLEQELPSAGQREYTQVIIKEAARLQALVDRLLAPHRRAPQRNLVNIHEVCERVRSVSLAQHPNGIVFIRDYDASIPEFLGDREQLIQVLLNLVQNAIQAMHASGEIRLKTRVGRQLTIARKRCKLALELHVVDSGPGVPEEIRSRVFFPLVSGREGGSGLGLSLAQSFVQQSGGTIEFESAPGRTDFKILLPMEFN
jgi:two-component system, NtrC family, nitrogen regulation sensor histidine kinase GlnL